MHENFTTFTYFCDLGLAQFLFTPAQLLWYSSTTATCIHRPSLPIHYFYHSIHSGLYLQSCHEYFSLAPQDQSPLASNFSSCSAVLNFDADTPLAALSSHQSLSTEQSFFPQQYKKERPCDKLSSPAGRRIE